MSVIVSCSLSPESGVQPAEWVRIISRAQLILNHLYFDYFNFQLQQLSNSDNKGACRALHAHIMSALDFIKLLNICWPQKSWWAVFHISQLSLLIHITCRMFHFKNLGICSNHLVLINSIKRVQEQCSPEWKMSLSIDQIFVLLFVCFMYFFHIPVDITILSVFRLNLSGFVVLVLQCFCMSVPF